MEFIEAAQVTPIWMDVASGKRVESPLSKWAATWNVWRLAGDCIDRSYYPTVFPLGRTFHVTRVSGISPTAAIPKGSGG